MKCSGFYFDSESDPKKAAVDIEFTAQQVKLSVKGRSQVIVWDQSKLSSYSGGSSEHLYFFHKTNLSNPSFYIERNKDLDQFLLKNSNPELQQMVKKRKNKSKLNWSFAAIGIFMLIAFFVFLFSLKDQVVDFAVANIPYKIEKQLGDTLFNNLKAQFKFVEDKELLDQYKKIAENSLVNLEPPYNDIQLYIVKSDETNAFAMPGGHIVFFEGALKEFKNYSEFAGVLQHEISHVKLRHSLKNILSSVSTYLLVSVFLGDASGLIAVLADQGSFLLRQSYSREYELDADNAAFEALVKSKIDPRGLLGFFQSLLDKSNSKLEENLEWISTHPATQHRIDNILKRYEKEISQELRASLVMNNPEFKSWKTKYYSKGKQTQ